MPTAVTTGATGVTASAATLRGSGNPNSAATTGWFRYDMANPGTCNDTFGTRMPSSSTSDAALGSGAAPVSYSQSITGLSPGTTYYYCAIDSNTYGKGYGEILSFTTLAAAPTVTTGGAGQLTGTSRQLAGVVTPRGAATTAWFRYATTSPGSCNDTFGTRAPASGGYAAGSGNTNINYYESISGLTPGTTYYYCAIAQNSVGTAYGTVLSFTTPVTPVVTTAAASNIYNTSVTVNGTGTPNGAAMTGWFRYSTTNPGSCDDTFGSRAPASGGTSLGSGTTAVAYSQTITGLTSGATYYYCAIGSTAEGTAFGSVMSVTTASAPTATTQTATSVTASSAYLRGNGNPNGAATTGWFRYSSVNPGTCNDTFGSRIPTSGGSSLGSGTAPVSYSQSVATGLSPGTTYYYCAIDSNAYGMGYGEVLSFTTLATAPIVTTSSATQLAGTTGTLYGSVNPRGAATTAWFRYATTSPGTCNDTFGTRAPVSGGYSAGSGASNRGYSETITGLTPGTTYYYCAIAQNSEGTAYGNVLSLTTPLSPTVITSAASSITNTSLTLNGTGTPNGAAMTGWFRYSTTNPGSCDDTFGSRAPASGGTSLGSGTTAVAYSQTITGLTSGATYYYCAIGSTAEGTAFGSVMSVTTASAPTATTLAASSVADTSAVLRGNGTPNRATTTGWFRYSTTNPGSCNDTFGSRAPSSSSSDTSLGAGDTSGSYSQSITGLTPGTTYYYCAIDNNTYGKGYGEVLSFTTPAITTALASNASGISVTLNGTGTPNGAAMTGWFRYSTTNPGSCNDTFGTRAPTSGGSSLGSGTEPVAYSQTIAGLTPGTTYYFCAIGATGGGKAYGIVRSISTLTAPTVTTNGARQLTGTTGILAGLVNPRGAATTAWFRYATVNPGTCNDTFGTRAPDTGGYLTSSSYIDWGYYQAITGLTPGTTYYYCAIAQNSEGTSYGSVVSFTPNVNTLAATPVTATTATLNGQFDPGTNSTTGWFRYSTTNPGTCNDTFGTRAPASGGTALGSGSTRVSYSQSITGLSPGVTYYFCAISTNNVGLRLGEVLSFTTPPTPPSVTSAAATLIMSGSATLNGTAVPNGAPTTGWFRYSTTNPGTCNDTFGTRAPATGGSPLGSVGPGVSYSQSITGLAPTTTYYYCAIAQNSVDTSYGSVLSFTTPQSPPVTTLSATHIADTGVTLNGVGNPRGMAMTGWFRYSTTNPGICNDTFGTRTPSSGGASLGSGTSEVAYSQTISGLTEGTTYYYCAIGTSANGTVFGNLVSVTTATVETLTVTLTGNGSGTVTSSPAGISCTSGTCISTAFTAGSTVSLHATKSGNSVFDGWSGDCGGTADCSVLMDRDRSVVATFVTYLPVRITGATPTYYGSFLEALAAAASGSAVTLHAHGIDFQEGFSLTKDVAIILKGGYDGGYSTQAGTTVLRGAMTIGSGSVIVENLVIQ